MDELELLVIQHQPDAITTRLSLPQRHSYLGDAVLGAIDGCVTTFAIIAGAAGAGFSANIAIVLGFANLVADGFSMAVSNYQNTTSKQELLIKARREEERHIDMVPEGETEEIRQIFANKGFKGEALQNIIDVVTENKRLWVDTMLTEELGLPLETPRPLYAAIATFLAFLVVGTIPIFPLLISDFTVQQMFIVSAIATASAFLAIGIVKGIILEQSIMKAGLETLLMGGSAASLAFLIGKWLQ